MQKKLIITYSLTVITFAVFLLQSISHFYYTPDDTYIYLQFAKNISGGKGFAFNAGTPTYGTTGPLWALIIAFGMKLGFDGLIFAKVLDLLLALSTLVILYVVTYRIIQHQLIAAFAVIIFSIDIWFLRWTGTGMETSLATALVLLVFLFFLFKKELIGGIVVGLFTLVRPEGIILLFVALIYTFFSTFRSEQKHKWISSVLRTLVGFGVVNIPWLFYAKTTFGRFLPNTFEAKSAVAFSLRGFFETGFPVIKMIGASELLTGIVAVVGIITLWKKINTEKVFLLWILLLPLAYALQETQVISRYLVPILPFIVVFSVLVVYKWIQRYEKVKFKVQLIIIGLVILHIGQNQYIYYEDVRPHLKEFADGIENCFKPISEWLRDNTPEGTIVLTPDVGMMGFISDRIMYDTPGLITPEMKKAFGKLSYNEGILQGVYRNCVVPHYLVDRSQVPERLKSDTLAPILTYYFPSSGVNIQTKLYYTLYKVVR